MLEEVTNYSPKPTIQEMLGYGLLEFHEAVFIFTRWPEYLVKTQCEKVAQMKRIPRSFFYEPAPPSENSSPLEWRFDPRKERDCFITYNAMKEAVASGELVPDRIENLGINTVYGCWQKKDNRLTFHGEWVSYLFTPDKVIHWVLLNGVDIPEDLQVAIGIHMLKGKVDKTVIKRVKNKIVYQFLNEFYPGKKESEYYSHEWMRIYGSIEKSDDEEFGSIRKATQEFRPNQEKGAPLKEDKKNGFYIPKAMEEIVCEDPSGMHRYHIPLLRVAMETAANILLGKCLEENLPKVNTDLFLGWFMKNKVVLLYTKQAPQQIVELIQMFVRCTVAGFFENLKK
jgi:hypothetical protein